MSKEHKFDDTGFGPCEGCGKHAEQLLYERFCCGFNLQRLEQNVIDAAIILVEESPMDTRDEYYISENQGKEFKVLAKAVLELNRVTQK